MQLHKDGTHHSFSSEHRLGTKQHRHKVMPSTAPAPQTPLAEAPGTWSEMEVMQREDGLDY